MKTSELGLSRNENTFLEDILHGENVLLDSESYDEFDSLFAELKKTWLSL